jgi:hypothetical protein
VEMLACSHDKGYDLSRGFDTDEWFDFPAGRLARHTPAIPLLISCLRGCSSSSSYICLAEEHGFMTGYYTHRKRLSAMEGISYSGYELLPKKRLLSAFLLLLLVGY